MTYRIVERHKSIFNIDDDSGDFGRLHPVKITFEIETILWPPKTIKVFQSFYAATTWAKRNKMEIGEIG